MNQELLWNMLLRGHDTFYLWCPRGESVEETLLLHEVYADVLEYREFLDEGEPVTFQVPDREGPVILKKPRAFFAKHSGRVLPQHRWKYHRLVAFLFRMSNTPEKNSELSPGSDLRISC